MRFAVRTKAGEDGWDGQVGLLKAASLAVVGGQGGSILPWPSVPEFPDLMGKCL